MDDDVMAKLEVLSSLKARHGELNGIQKGLLDDVERLKVTDKFLAESRLESDHLEREKQSHTDTIRLINKDIEEMDAVIKGTEDDRQKLLRAIRQQMEEFMPKKDEVDRMRNFIDLPPTSSLSEMGIPVGAVHPERPTAVPPTFPSMLMQPGSDHYGFHHHHHMGMPFNHQPSALMVGSGMNPRNTMDIGNSRMALQQKPAPMKICPSCSSEIHRNAPICPTCKSKSRSKNPKKAKRKTPPT